MFVLAHEWKALTFHSLHDGTTLRITKPFDWDPSEGTPAPYVTDMWWIKHDVKPRSEAFKDMLDRKEIVSNAKSHIKTRPKSPNCSQEVLIPF